MPASPSHMSSSSIVSCQRTRWSLLLPSSNIREAATGADSRKEMAIRPAHLVVSEVNMPSVTVWVS